jgi:hypothetical protein
LGRSLSFDSELFFVASMLHDVGLTDDFAQGSDRSRPYVSGYAEKDAPCFAVRGAGVAKSLATNDGRPRSFSDALAEAISLHLNVRVARSRGVEAHLLHAASAFDVIRLKRQRLSPETIQSIEGERPSGGSFCDDMLAAWDRESTAHPDCRVAFLNSWPFSFERRICRACPPQ